MTTKRYKVVILGCKKCYHQWAKRGLNDPRRCPSCRSVLWNHPNLWEINCFSCTEPISAFLCPKCGIENVFQKNIEAVLAQRHAPSEA